MTGQDFVHPSVWLLEQVLATAKQNPFYVIMTGGSRGSQTPCLELRTKDQRGGSKTLQYSRYSGRDDPLDVVTRFS